MVDAKSANVERVHVAVRILGSLEVGDEPVQTALEARARPCGVRRTCRNADGPFSTPDAIASSAAWRSIIAASAPRELVGQGVVAS